MVISNHEHTTKNLYGPMLFYIRLICISIEYAMNCKAKTKYSCKT